MGALHEAADPIQSLRPFGGGDQQTEDLFVFPLCNCAFQKKLNKVSEAEKQETERQQRRRRKEWSGRQTVGMLPFTPSLPKWWQQGQSWEPRTPLGIPQGGSSPHSQAHPDSVSVLESGVKRSSSPGWTDSWAHFKNLSLSFLTSEVKSGLYLSVTK